MLVPCSPSCSYLRKSYSWDPLIVYLSGSRSPDHIRGLTVSISEVTILIHGSVLWSLGLRVQPRDALPLMYLSTTVLCPVMLYAVPLSCSALGTTRPGRSYIGISGPADLREVKPSTILGSQDLEVSRSHSGSGLLRALGAHDRMGLPALSSYVPYYGACCSATKHYVLHVLPHEV